MRSGGLIGLWLSRCGPVVLLVRLLVGLLRVGLGIGHLSIQFVQCPRELFATFLTRIFRRSLTGARFAGCRHRQGQHLRELIGGLLYLFRCLANSLIGFRCSRWLGRGPLNRIGGLLRGGNRTVVDEFRCTVELLREFLLAKALFVSGGTAELFRGLANVLLNSLLLVGQLFRLRLRNAELVFELHALSELIQRIANVEKFRLCFITHPNGQLGGWVRLVERIDRFLLQFVLAGSSLVSLFFGEFSGFIGRLLSAERPIDSILCRLDCGLERFGILGLSFESLLELTLLILRIAFLTLCVLDATSGFLLRGGPLLLFGVGRTELLRSGVSSESFQLILCASAAGFLLVDVQLLSLRRLFVQRLKRFVG